MLSKRGSEEGHLICSPEQRLSGMKCWSEKRTAPKCCYSTELNCLTELRAGPGDTRGAEDRGLYPNNARGTEVSTHRSDPVRCVSQRPLWCPHGTYSWRRDRKWKARKMLPCHYPGKGWGRLRPLLCLEGPSHYLGSPGFPFLSLPNASGLCASSQESLL